MYKLLVSDIDGTLVGSDELINEEIVNLSKKLKEKGILFTLATGRVQSLTYKFIEELLIDIPVIVSNGATIIQGEEIIQSKKIHVRGLKPIIEASLERGLSVVYTIDGVERAYNDTEWIRKEQAKHPNYNEILPFTEENWENLSIEKLMLMDDSRSGHISELESLADLLPEGYIFTRYTNKAIEIVEATSNKASALMIVQERLGISAEETIVIGDHLNDKELFEHAGFSAAVNNAQQEIKDIADYTTKASYGEGVIELMEMLLHDTIPNAYDRA